MKKKIVLLLAATMVLACTACGGKTDGPTAEINNGSANTAPTVESEATTNNADSNTTDSNSAGGGLFTSDLEYALSPGGAVLFMLNTTADMKENAWLGICPKGDYKTEVEADDVDIYYAYPSNYWDENGERDANNTYYEFEYQRDGWGVENGEYTLVLCDRDDEGEVVAQWNLIYDADADISIQVSK